MNTVIVNLSAKGVANETLFQHIVEKLSIVLCAFTNGILIQGS